MFSLNDLKERDTVNPMCDYLFSLIACETFLRCHKKILKRAELGRSKKTNNKSLNSVKAPMWLKKLFVNKKF